MLTAPARLIAVLVASGVPWTARASDSLSCDGGVVQVGDSKIELLGKCGEPALRDAWPVARGAVFLATVEEWTYNFGTSRFLMRVLLEGGKIISIQRGGYGYDPEQLRPARVGGPARCEPSLIHVGDFKIDLLARCGEPASRDLRIEERLLPRAHAGDTPLHGTVQVEAWTFDFGPQRFMVTAILEDGKVIRLERGSYGFAR